MNNDQTSNASFSLRSSLAYAQALGLVACSLSVSLLAQDPVLSPTAATPQPFASGANVQALSVEANIPSSALVVTKVPSGLFDVAAIVSPPPSEMRDILNVPASVPDVIVNYLPVPDTNPGIGIHYPPGSPEFVYLVAGIRPPWGDPRLPPIVPEEVDATIVPELPLVIYEPAEIGSGAIMTRLVLTEETYNEQTYDFPPGTVVRSAAPADPAPASGAPPPAQQGGSISYPETVTASEQDLVWDFPPGSKVVRNPPVDR